MPTESDRATLPENVIRFQQGIILKLHQGEIVPAVTRITATDAKQFERFANLVQHN